MQDTIEQHLYQFLSGDDAIAAGTDELLSRLLADPQLGGSWKGANLDNQRTVRQRSVDVMTAAARGPADDTGCDMRLAQVGMHISASDWVVFMKHSCATLAHLAVPERETQDVLA